jgi:hypothetical protein
MEEKYKVGQVWDYFGCHVRVVWTNGTAVVTEQIRNPGVNLWLGPEGIPGMLVKNADGTPAGSPEQPYLPKYRRLPVEGKGGVGVKGEYYVAYHPDGHYLSLEHWMAHKEFVGFEYEFGVVSSYPIAYLYNTVDWCDGAFWCTVDAKLLSDGDSRAERPKYVLVKTDG